MARKPTGQTNDFKAFWDPFSMAEGNPLFIAASAQARVVKAMLEWQIEAMDFVKDRYSKDIAFLDKMTKSAEVPDVLTSCSEFFQEAVDDYSREGVKIANFGSRMAADAASEVQKQTEVLQGELKAVATVAA